MNMNVNEKLKAYPPEYPSDLLATIRSEFLDSGKTLVVLDDDPTGTQTCSDVIVLISWGIEEITEELKKKPSILFILTNSRSLTTEQSILLTKQLGQNLKIAVESSGQDIVIISRSDSTLRGHYPEEVDAIADAMNLQDAIRVLIPAFIEGKRYTIDDIHYVVENQDLIPVAETPFAKDIVFGYRHSNLKEWIEEKTKGAVKKKNVISLSLTDIRLGGPEQIKNILMQADAKNVIIVNATGYKDLEVVALGLILAEKEGKQFLYRSSATFVPVLAGLISGQAYKPDGNPYQSGSGTLLVVGSYVPKTSTQLNWLLSTNQYESIEIKVSAVLDSDQLDSLAIPIIQQTEAWLSAGKQVILYTSRIQEKGTDDDSSLDINARVSAFLVHLVKSLQVRPRFILAKGGITSSDLASKALVSKKAKVLGAIIPGVPVWQLDESSKFPGMIYIVFPGNVGGEEALDEVVNKINGE